MNFLELFSIKREVFGLDISDLSLKVIKLKKANQGLELECCGEERIPKGIIRQGEVQDEKKLSQVISSALGKLKGRLDTEYVAASLPEEKAYLEVIQMPKIPRQDLASAVVYEAENYIPIPLEKVYLGFQVVKPVRNSLDHHDVLVAALSKDTIDPYVSALTSAGLEPVALEIESLSIARAMIEQGMAPSPVLLIDFGETRTSFVIFSGYAPRFTSSISVSSGNFTEIIARALGVSIAKAEELKKKYGLTGKTKEEQTTPSEKEERKVFEALIPVLVDLTQQIRKHLDYYHSHASHEHLRGPSRVSKIMLCGGGSNLKGLPEIISMELNLPVEVNDIFKNIIQKKMKLTQEESLGYATALGLALRQYQKQT